jgi:hypothetical protein
VISTTLPLLQGPIHSDLSDEGTARVIRPSVGRRQRGLSEQAKRGGLQPVRRGFSTSDTAAMARVAYDLESVPSPRTRSCSACLSEASSARLIASIISVEARHCAVLADLAGLGNNLDALLVNSADPISFEEQ